MALAHQILANFVSNIFHQLIGGQYGVGIVGNVGTADLVRRAHPLCMSESGLVWFVMASADSECGDVVQIDVWIEPP